MIDTILVCHFSSVGHRHRKKTESHMLGIVESLKRNTLSNSLPSLALLKPGQKDSRGNPIESVQDLKNLDQSEWKKLR